MTILAGLGGLLFAGPLDPPPGPVAPTFKTLSDVEPRTAINAVNTPGDATATCRITAPGSYYLSGNLTGQVGKNGIVIASAGVTIDLGGFELAGVPGSLSGIFAEANADNVALKGGTVRSWGTTGINLSNSRGICMENLFVQLNTGKGIRIGGSFSLRGCVSHSNGDDGFFTGSDGVVRDCIAYNNQVDGFQAANNVTISACTFRSNRGRGLDVISNGCVKDCVVSDNDLDGIAVGNDCRVADNQCTGNGLAGTGAGVRVSGSDNRIEGNNCSDADFGIQIVSTGNVIIRNTCSGNTTNFNVGGGNFWGTVVTTEAAMNAAVNSNVNIAY